MSVRPYFAIFTSGLQEFVAEIVSGFSAGTRVTAVHDGLIEFESELSGPGIAGSGLFNNAFALLRRSDSGADPVSGLLDWASGSRGFIDGVLGSITGSPTFRVVTLQGNTPVNAYARKVGEIEKHLARHTRLTINRHNPDFEVWFILRDEGFGLAGVRLTRPERSAADMRKGELKPQLAYALALMADTGEGDVVVDPFTGTGAIPLQIAERCGFGALIACDKNGVIISRRLTRMADRDPRIRVFIANAQNMNYLADGEADAVVTDPPWGVHAPLNEPERFYESFLIESARVLKPGGRLVLLTALGDMTGEIASRTPGYYEPMSRFDILVSGQKASILRFTRTGVPLDPGVRNPVPAVSAAKKTFGQNFLTNRGILEREADYADIKPTDSILEIGPAYGNLTRILLERGRSVFAIEADADFIPDLDELSREYPSFEYRIGDALGAPLPPADKIVSNLPYRIALPFIFALLDTDFDTGVFVIQDELAQRICAKPGKPGYGRIGVAIQRRASVRLLETVKAYEFLPPPTVDSAIVRIRKTRPRFRVPSDEYFSRVLDFLFFHRDAPLESALASLEGYGVRSSAIRGSLGVAMRRTVQELTPEELGAAATAVHDAGIDVPILTNHEKRTAQKIRKESPPGRPPRRSGGRKRSG